MKRGMRNSEGVEDNERYIFGFTNIALNDGGGAKVGVGVGGPLG